MTANIGIRLIAPNGAFVTISPTTSSRFKIDITDVLGQRLDQKTFEEATEWVLVNVCALRNQLFEMLGRKPSATVKADE